MGANGKVITSTKDMHGMLVACERRYGPHPALSPEGENRWRISAWFGYVENVIVRYESGRMVARYDDPMSYTADEWYKIASAAGMDYGNRSMRAAHRTEWNEDDWNCAANVTNEILARRKIQ